MKFDYPKITRWYPDIEVHLYYERGSFNEGSDRTSPDDIFIFVGTINKGIIHSEKYHIDAVHIDKINPFEIVSDLMNKIKKRIKQ